MEENLKALYIREIVQSRLDFDRDPDYQAYYTQAEALWEEGDMPSAVFHLLDTSSFLSFAHGFRLGAELAGWLWTGISPAVFSGTAPYKSRGRRRPPQGFQCRQCSRRRRPPRGPNR